jgi:hypothetical protein
LPEQWQHPVGKSNEQWQHPVGKSNEQWQHPVGKSNEQKQNIHTPIYMTVLLVWYRQFNKK